VPTVSPLHRRPRPVVVLAAVGLGVVYLLVAADPASAGTLKDMADRMKTEMIAVAVAFAVTALIVVAAFLGALRKFPALALAVLVMSIPIGMASTPDSATRFAKGIYDTIMGSTDNGGGGEGAGGGGRGGR